MESQAVLLHNGNILPSIPITHSVHLKETYENMEILMKAIKYESYNWFVSGDLKVIEMQPGITKHCCFLCLWHSRNVKQHYSKTQLQLRTTYVPGETASNLFL